MAVVFATSPVNQREQYYGDVLGEVYEFPRRYVKRVAEGDVFVYYRGTKGGGDPGYFGTGVIGPIRQSPNRDRLLCDLFDVTLFDVVVPLRDPVTDDYFEVVGPNRVFLQQGVRRIPEETLARILALTSVPPAAPEPGPQYARSRAMKEAVERYAVDVVMALLRSDFPLADVREQPRTNPGYDILLTGAPVSYAEVKGTTSKEVGFFMSEGERCFAENHAESYRLYVVYGIDLDHSTHRVFCHAGSIDLSLFDLAPVQYRVGLVKKSRPASS